MDFLLLAVSVLNTRTVNAAGQSFWMQTYSFLTASVLDTRLVIAAAGQSIWTLTYCSASLHAASEN